jgi:L-serine/L-threonine ammonia-lyase
VRSHVASDADAVSACLRFCDDHRLLVEPACGAALAAVYTAAPALAMASSVVVVVCGGAVVDAASLRATARKLGVALPD